MSKNNKNNPKKIVKIDFESIFGNDGREAAVKLYSFCSEDYMQDGNWEYCLNTIFLFYRYKKPLILNKKIKNKFTFLCPDTL